MAAKVNLIQLAAEGKEKEIMTALDSAKEFMIRRAIRIAKRKGELSALIMLKKVLKTISPTTTVVVKEDEKSVVIYKVSRTAQVDGESFDAICDFAKAKKGRLLSATNYTSYYGFSEKATGSKFAEEARKQIDKYPTFKGITIELDKEKVGEAIAKKK